MSLVNEFQAGRLRAGAFSAIWHAHHATFCDSWVLREGGKRPPEEDFVAFFIIEGLPRLMNAWRPFFSEWKIQLSLAGVFCHQTPKAEFTMGTQVVAPELADLLIVRRHTDQSGQSRQVASLIQVKMSDNGDVSLLRDDPQLYLLSQWPSFRIKGRNAPAKHFSVGKAERQAVYAAVSDTFSYPEDNLGWPDSCSWGTYLPVRKGSVEKSLASFLIDLLNFKEGREFYDVGTTACDWSELIYYLLNTTFSMPMRTRDRVFSQARGISLKLNRVAYMATEGWFAPAYVNPEMIKAETTDGKPPDDRENIEYAEGGQGRVILIETSEVRG